VLNATLVKDTKKSLEMSQVLARRPNGQACKLKGEVYFMEHIATIITLASAAAGLLCTSLTFLVRLLKAAKDKKRALQTIRICDAVLPFIRQAEGFVNYSSLEKKAFVMTKANQFAIEQKIPFNTELIDSKIEELVKLTKEVNRRERDGINATVAQSPFTYVVN